MVLHPSHLLLVTLVDLYIIYSSLASWVHPYGMLFSRVFVFTERASRWDAILLRPTNPVGINYR